jgi:hypothetical protein
LQKKKKIVVIEHAKCDYCEKEIAPGERLYTMSIDFNSYLTVGSKDHMAVEEVTEDVLAEGGDTYSYELCERCYWALKDFIQKGLRKKERPQQYRQNRRRGTLPRDGNNTNGFGSLAA